MEEPDDEPITHSESDSPASQFHFNVRLVLTVAAVAVVGTLNFWVPQVHRLLSHQHEIHFLYEGGGLALTGAVIIRRAIKRRFSRQPIEKIPDWL